MSRPPRRGEVYWVNLDPVVGTEIRKTRPAVIVSNDSCNRYGTRAVVLPITGNVDSLYPGEAAVDVKGKPGRAGTWRPDSVHRQETIEGSCEHGDAGRDGTDDEALAVTLGLPM